MEIHVSIGENRRFELREALLIYGDRQRSFVTRHRVMLHQNGPPTLDVAQPLTIASSSRWRTRFMAAPRPRCCRNMFSPKAIA